MKVLSYVTADLPIIDTHIHLYDPHRAGGLAAGIGQGVVSHRSAQAL